MKTVKQILENLDLTEYASEDFQKIEILSREGLFEEARLPILHNALNKDPDDWTDAEKRIISESLKQITNCLVTEDVNSFMKKNVEKNIPVVIVLRRKAIRAFPDNQKIALYYSQALDKHVSIPFGPNNDALGIHLDEMASPNPLPMTTDTTPVTDDIPDAIKVRLARIRKLKRKKSVDGVFIDTPVDDVDSEKPKAPVVPFQARITQSPVPSLVQRMRKSNNDAAIQHSNDVSDGMSMSNSQLAKLGAAGQRKAMAAAKAAPVPLLDRLAIQAGSALSVGVRRGVNSLLNIGKSPIQKRGIKRVRRVRKPISEEGVLDTIHSTARNFSRQALDTLNKGAKYLNPVEAPISGLKAGKKLIKRYVPGGREAIGKAKETIQKAAPLAAAALLGREVITATHDGSTQSFTPGARKELAQISDPRTNYNNPYNERIKQGIIWKQPASSPGQYAMGESVNNIKILRNIVETDTPTELIFGDNSISINRNIANKILNVYESLNKKNKKKVERMLNENFDSFKEVLNFSIRQ